ncbi:MAG: tRNA lysidine(34) synthetase TilS [Ardenticatenaceae bacterium]|nr:tRNA lysidine(34) synthetase TilS [Ardenticatenaceae bacterium]MCB8988703.1 tRNA lysidine(34) synthetase TilS [Ardenticatenaceae bacterium]
MVDLARIVRPFLLQAAAAQQRPFPEARFVVGVSGGADSLALLHVLNGITHRDQLLVAHLNHGWRSTAVLDVQFVAQTAAQMGIACAVETVDVVAQAQANGQSLEEAGRLARYRFFARLARQHDATAVLVAHNADDQAETVLLHLLRGAGLGGLAGMRPVAPLPEAPEVELVRPFLSISRAEIETYCREHALIPVQDSTNADVAFQRNRLRHHLLPQLATYNPQIKTHLQQLAELAAADDACLGQLAAAHWPELLLEQTEDWLVLDRARWLALPLALRRRSLRQALTIFRPFLSNVSYATVEQARQVAEKGETGAQSTLTGGLLLQVDYGRLLITANPAARPGDWPQAPEGVVLTLPVPGTVALANGWQLDAVLLPQVEWQLGRHNPDPWTAYLAVNTSSLVVRGRKPGERFAPLGMHGRSATLKEVMINRKIAAAWRANWPLVCTAEHLVWLVGHQIDERAKITDSAEAIVQLRCFKS